MATGVVPVALVLIINITTNLLLTRWKSKAS